MFIINQARSNWVAAKELELSYHNRDMQQLTWHLNYGNLNTLT